MKNCLNKKCLQTNPQSLSSFTKHKWRKDGLQDNCKSCIKVTRREHYDQNKQSILQYKKEYRKTNKEKRSQYMRNYYQINKISLNKKRKLTRRADCLRREFGMTLEQRNQMLLSQKNCCAICHIEYSEYYKNKKRDFCIDHDHKTGKVRALLCDLCNKMLGMSGDNPSRLRDGAAYLELFT